MKNLLLLSFIVLVSACATTKPVLLSYEDYAKAKEIQSNRGKNDLFVVANSWMVKTFNSPQDVIQYTDKEAGIIKGKFLIGGSLDYNASPTDTRVFAILTLQVKDSLSKITIAPQGTGTYYQSNTGYSGLKKSFPGENTIKMKIDYLIMDYEVYQSMYKDW